MSSVVSVAFYKIDASGKGAKQGLELRTNAGPLRLAAVEPCALDVPACPGDSAAALAAVDAFLKDATLPEARAQYGGEQGNLRTAAALLVAFLTASVIGWQRVRVTVSLATRRLVVSRRRALLPLRHTSFAVDHVREAVFSNTRVGTKRSYAVYLVTHDDYFELARAPGRPVVAQRFVDDLNRTLRGLGLTVTTPKATSATNVTPARAPATNLTDDPIVVRFAYRGWSAVALAIAVAVNALVLFGNERQELHCSRRSGICRLETHGLLSSDGRSVSLARVTGVSLYKLPKGKNSVQGLELLTDAAPEVLPANDSCPGTDLASYCVGGSQQAYAAARAFLSDARQQELHTSYGVIGEGLPVLDAIFGLFLLATLLQWQSFRVAISASDASVSVVRRRAGFFVARFELELSNVLAANFDEKHKESKEQVWQRAQLLMKNEERIWLSRAWTVPSPELKRFVADLDAALAAARQRAQTRPPGKAMGALATYGGAS